LTKTNKEEQKFYRNNNMEESNEVRVKDEPICDSLSISQTIEVKRQSNKVKEDSEIETSSKSQVEVKVEEKFSETEEFANKASIVFLNEEITQATTSSDNQKAEISK